MSRVSHDATWSYHHGGTHRTNNLLRNTRNPIEKLRKNRILRSKRKSYGILWKRRFCLDLLRKRTYEKNGFVDTELYNRSNDDVTKEKRNNQDNFQKKGCSKFQIWKKNNSNIPVNKINTISRKNSTDTILEKRKFYKKRVSYNGCETICHKCFVKNKQWKREGHVTHNFEKKTSAVKRTNDRIKKKSKWDWNAGVLITLVILDIVGMSSAGDGSYSFSSALTSRMIASFLGYPSTCSLGTEVRPCTLSLTCWLRGGTRLRGCGGWLFSCCGPPEPSREGFDNSIPQSDWKYKVSPPKLRQVPQRSVMPNNVFRRRVDDDVSTMDCGVPSSRILQKRIIGGREARFAEFPWQAHVRISEFQCGGVLVSRWYVATAAHCVSRARARDVAVWLGAVDTSATHHPARKLGVVQKILHPLFQFRMTQPDRYDIALLKLSRPIMYTNNILPICLPDYDMDLRGRSGVIAGWGKTDANNGHTGTNLLRSATVPILSKEQCINWHESKQISVEIHSEMICAGHSDGHQDACLGDSGGPLIVLDNGRYYLVGITSAGFGCGVDHQPGIYHNVKVTAKWIRGIISPSVNYIDV